MRPAGRVVLLDPRGMGETDPGPTPGRSQSPFGNDVKEAFLSFHLSRPLLGQRVADVLRVLGRAGRRDRARREHNGFRVVGIGAAGPIVLHAALLDRDGLIKEVVLERSLVSWTDVVERGISRGQIGNVVPGVLEVYDLPDLAARWPRDRSGSPSPVNAMGQPIPRADLERAYAACIKAYGLVGSARVKIRLGISRWIPAPGDHERRSERPSTRSDADRAIMKKSSPGGRKPGHFLDELRATFADRANRPAIVYQDRSWTYGELDAKARRCAARLRQLGVKRGDRVAIVTPEKLPFLAAHLGTLYAAARLAPLEPVAHGRRAAVFPPG